MPKSIALAVLSALVGTSCGADVIRDDRSADAAVGSGAGGSGAAGTGGAGSGAGGPGGSSGSGAGAVQCGGDRVIWAERFGGLSGDQPVALAPDAEGGVFVAGSFAGTLDLGGEPLQSAGGTAVFVARFDGAGGHVWSKRLALGEGSAATIARAQNGDLLLGGDFTGTVDFGDGARTAVGIDAFVSRLAAADGAPLWTWTPTGSGDEFVKSIAADPTSMDLVIGAGFSDSIEIGAPAYSSAGGKDIALARLDGGGVPVWSHAFGGPANDSANGVAVDAQGRIVFGGAIGQGVDLGTGVLAVPSSEHSDAYVAVYSMDGDPIWAQNYGDAETQDLHRVDVDPRTGNIVVAGRTDGTVDFGGGELGALQQALFIAALTIDGDHVASALLGSVSTTSGQALAPGQVLVASSFNQPVEIAGAALVPAGRAGEPDALLVGLGSGLVPAWTLHFGDIGADRARAVATGADGNLYLAAEFSGTVTLPGCPAPFTSAGDTDILLIKLAP